MHHIIVTELIKSEVIRVEQSSHASTSVVRFADVWQKARVLMRYRPSVRVRGGSVAHRPVCSCGTVRQA